MRPRARENAVFDRARECMKLSRMRARASTAPWTVAVAVTRR
jgi:hypothetical protein